MVGAYTLFILNEYSMWIAILVYAYSRGGATVAGVVALVQLVPGALLAPVFAALADRHSPVALLTGGYLVQAVFGLVEGLTFAGLAIGAVLVPGLVHLGGTPLALLGVAAVLPLAAAAGGRALFSLDAQAPVPVVQIALLRLAPLFAELPAPALEGLAAALTPVEVPAGEAVIRQGEQGDAYYLIAAGQFDVVQDGRLLRRCGRGEGVGEIALLHAVPRTASVVARTSATVYKLAREPFLTAVLGHAATERQARTIASDLLRADAARDDDPHATEAADPG